MATQLKLYQGAHLLLRELATGITVADDSRFVNTLNLIYDDAVAYMLEQGMWNFATRTVGLDADEDVEPEFGFTFAMPKPDDYAGRMIAIATDERFHCALQDYHEEGGLGGYFFSNVDPLYLRYISNAVEYGLNLGDWPLTFVRAVEYELAFRVAPHLTTMGEEALDQLEKRRNKALRDARSKDALNQGAMYPPAGRLTTSRGSRFGARWRS